MPALHIPPSIGRQVWFWMHSIQPHEVMNPGQACAATVCFVHHPNLVNLQVIGHDGHSFIARSVELRDYDSAEVPKHGTGSAFATWMPYQAEQARKAQVNTDAQAGADEERGPTGP